jgi:Tol biopolymer transport system component
MKTDKLLLTAIAVVAILFSLDCIKQYRITYIRPAYEGSEILLMDADGNNLTKLTLNGGEEPVWSPDGCRIAFVSDRDGDWEIFVMDADGRNQTQLTNNTSDDRCPAWSPDGRCIAFESNRDGIRQIYVMDADGSNQTQLTLTGGEDPDWSPDGRRIVFLSEYEKISVTTGSFYNGHDVETYYDYVDGDSAIFVMDTDGGNQKQLTHNDCRDSAPTWSPDGQFIAFESDRTGNHEIFAMDADGSNQTQLTDGSGWHPAWSPNGLRIAFHSKRTGKFELFVMNADGNNETQLTARGGEAPTWSPDGCSIVYSRSGSWPNEIFKMDADGSNQTQLTNFWESLLRYNISGDLHTWSPDGCRIAIVVRNPERADEIVLMKADGSEQTKLIVEGGASKPAWSSNSRRIAFSSHCDEDAEIFVVDANGMNLRQLTFSMPIEVFSRFFHESVYNVYPAWSPDGRHIAFNSNCGGSCQICVIDTDSGNLTKLTDSADWESRPAWSPDNRRIAFNTIHAIFVINADGSDETQLTTDDAYNQYAPIWSPDGSRIVYIHDVLCFSVMDADGGNQTPGTRGKDPDWSPDSRRIAFSSQDKEYTYQIFVMDSDGGNVTQLTTESGWSPVWCPVE